MSSEAISGVAEKLPFPRSAPLGTSADSLTTAVQTRVPFLDLKAQYLSERPSRIENR